MSASISQQSFIPQWVAVQFLTARTHLIYQQLSFSIVSQLLSWPQVVLVSQPGDLADMLAKSCRFLTGLQEVNLSGLKLGFPFISSLTEAIGQNLPVARLDLSGNDLVDPAIAALARSLQGNRSLEWLDVSRNAIEDAGVAELARVMAKHPTLR